MSFNVLDKEQKMQIMKIAIVIGFLVAGCIVGKTAMNVYDMYISFNGSAIGIMLGGDFDVAAK